MTPASGPILMRLRLIGQMEAWTVASDNILPTGRKTRALLGIVALLAPRPVPRNRIAEMLWSRRPEEQARASLRQEIHRLLAALDPFGPDVLHVTRDHLAIRPGAIWLDVDEVLCATPAHSATLSLFDGELMEDLDGVDPAFDAWLTSERQRLRDRARALGEALLSEQTEPDEVISAAQRLLSIDRSHEQAWRALMRAYAVRGDRGMAIQVYDRCRAALAEQLDAEPSAETQRLLAEIKSDPPTGIVTRSIDTEPPARNGTETIGPVLATMPVAPRAQANQPQDAAAVPLDESPSAQHEAPHAEARPAVLRAGVRVGMLPLTLIGIASEEAYLGTSLAEDVTAALTRFRWMSLVSSSALARFASQTRDEAAIRQMFGLDLLLDGTVQRAGERLRVSIRLLDLRLGNDIVWTGRFSREVLDPLVALDEITAEVAARVESEIYQMESQRAAAQANSAPTAHDLLLRSLPLMLRLDRASFMQAGQMLTRAMELDPDHAAGHAWSALWHALLVGQGWADDADDAIAKAGRLAERAIMLDPQDARTLTIGGHLRARLQNRRLEAITLHDRAIAINPSLAMAWNLSGLCCAYLGDHEEAERRIARYKQLLPLDPHAFFFETSRIVVALLRHRHEEAVAIGRDVTAMNPAFTESLKPYLAALGHIGERRETEMARDRLLKLEPQFTIERFLTSAPFQREEDRQHFAEGLRLAGIAA